MPFAHIPSTARYVGKTDCMTATLAGTVMLQGRSMQHRVARDFNVHMLHCALRKSLLLLHIVDKDCQVLRSHGVTEHCCLHWR